MSSQDFGIHSDPYTKHQLFAFALRLDRLWSEFSPRGYEPHLPPDCESSARVQYNACRISDFCFPSVRSWQIDVHVDVVNVKHGEHLAPGRKNFSYIC